MKSDISIPNVVFHAAENLAKKMGISLSELYIAALNAYVAEHQEENITETLNQVYSDEPSTLEPELVKMQVVSLEREQIESFKASLNNSAFEYLRDPEEDIYIISDGKPFHEA